MRIEQIELRYVKLPLRGHFETSFIRSFDRDTIVVTVWADTKPSQRLVSQAASSTAESRKNGSRSVSTSRITSTSRSTRRGWVTVSA